MAEGVEKPSLHHQFSEQPKESSSPSPSSEEAETGDEEENVKLFVGQIPKRMTESELLSFFHDYALVVHQVNIIRDKQTRASRGTFTFSLNHHHHQSIYIWILLFVDLLWW